MSLSNRQVRNVTCLIDAYFEATNLSFVCHFSVFCNGDIGDGDPAGNLSLCGDEDGEKCSPDDINGDGDGEFFPPWGRGWEGVPRRGIPR
jgi:hypothetical protein